MSKEIRGRFSYDEISIREVLKLPNLADGVSTQVLAVLPSGIVGVTTINGLGYSDQQVRDVVSTLIKNSTGITWNYDQAGGALTPNITISQYTDNQAKAAIGNILGSTNSLVLSYSAIGNIITGDVSSNWARGLISANAPLSYNSATGVITSSLTQYTDLQAQNAVGSILAAGEFTYNSGAHTIVVNQVASTKITGTKTSAFISDFSTAADARITLQKGAVNGIAPLDGNQKVPSTYLPAMFINNVFVVGSQAAMLALTAVQGDIAIRTDLNKSYALATSSPTTLADWKEILATPSVLSVNGFTGTVSLTTTNISEGTNLYYTQARFDTAFGLKTTDNLPQGTTNLYYTDTKVAAYSDSHYIQNQTSVAQVAGFYINGQGRTSGSFRSNFLYSDSAQSALRLGRAGDTYLNVYFGNNFNRNLNMTVIGNTAYFQALGEGGSYWNNVVYGGYNDVGTQPHIDFGFGSTGQHRFANTGNVLLGIFSDDTVNRLQVNGSIKAAALASLGTPPSTLGVVKPMVTDTQGRFSFVDSFVAGTNKSVQYNNSGVFGGDGNFSWDNALQRLEIIGDIYSHRQVINPTPGAQRAYLFSDYQWTGTTAILAGAVVSANINRMDYELGISRSFNANTINTSNFNWLRLYGLNNTTATASVEQTATRRAISANAALISIPDTTGNTTVFDHVAAFQAYAVQDAVTNSATITHYYGMLLGDSKALAGNKITNGWGVWQDGATDINIYRGKSIYGNIPVLPSVPAPTAFIDINATNGYEQLRMRTSFTPVSTADPSGSLGTLSWDDNYLYMKTGNGWKRIAWGVSW